MKTTPPIVILAGGTGGHVFPALAVCGELSGHRLLWLGRAGGIEESCAAQAGAEFTAIEFSSPRRLAKALAGLPQLLRSCWRINKLFRERRPGLVIGFGSYISVPGALVALWRRIPLVVHEQNRYPGLANRLLSMWAKKIITAYPESFAGNSARVCIGNPLRAGHGAEPRPVRRYPEPGSRRNTCRLLALGGSQGADSINEMVPKALAAMAQSPRSSTRFKVRHFCGSGAEEQTRAAYAGIAKDKDIEVTAFSETMSGHYDWADIAVCRGGALTLSELAHHALPAIIVPLASATGEHQLANASWYAQSGGVLVVEEDPGAVNELIEALARLAGDGERLGRMSQALSSLARIDATRQFARHALGCLAANQGEQNA